MTEQDFNAKLEHLRACLYADPSDEAWRAVLAALDAFGPPQEGEASLAWGYAAGILDGWPSSLRAAPLRWLFELEAQRNPPKPAGWSLVRTVRARDLPKPDLNLRKLARGGWLTRITTLDLRDRRLDAETWRILLDTPGLDHLETLDLGRSDVTSARVERLASLSLPRLRSLDLSHSELHPAALKALACAPWPALEHLNASTLYAQPSAFAPLGQAAWSAALRSLDLSNSLLRDNKPTPQLAPWVHTFHVNHHAWARLELLNLSACKLRAPDLAALLASPLPALRRLSLASNTLEGLERAEPTARALLQHLENLDLSYTRLGDKGLRSLAREGAPHLRTLRLAGCALGPAGFQSLQELRAAHLEALDLSGNLPRREGVEALAHDPSLASLKSLDLSRCQLGPGHLAPLAQASNLAQLERLILSENLPSKEDLRALLASRSLPRLDYLALVGCKLDDATAIASLSSLSLPSLKALALSANQLGASSLSSLVSSPSFVNLELLDLSHNNLGDAAVERLLRAGPPPALRVLRLGSNQITDAGAQLLLDALPRYGLAELDLSHNRLSPRMEERLQEEAAERGLALSAGYQS